MTTNTDINTVDFPEPATMGTRFKYAAKSLFRNKPMCSKVYEELDPQWERKSAGWLEARKIGTDLYELSHVWQQANYSYTGDEVRQTTLRTLIAKDTPNVVISTVGSDDEMLHPQVSENSKRTIDDFECTGREAAAKIAEFEAAMDQVCAKDQIILFREVRDRKDAYGIDNTKYQVASYQPFMEYHP